MTIRKWDRLTEEKRREAIERLIHFFEKERGEEIGNIAADHLLNFFLESVGPDLYNQGIYDAKKAIEGRIEDINYDLDELLDL